MNKSMQAYYVKMLAFYKYLLCLRIIQLKSENLVEIIVVSEWIILLTIFEFLQKWPKVNEREP